MYKNKIKMIKINFQQHINDILTFFINLIFFHFRFHQKASWSEIWHGEGD